MRLGLSGWSCFGWDRGAASLLNVIAGKSFCTWLDLPQGSVTNTESFRQSLVNARPKGLLIGTSTSVEGSAIESQLRVVATELEIPVVCIEDFSGNYQFVEHAKTALLVVESEFSEEIYLRKLSHVPPIVIIPSVRYDKLRRTSAIYPLVANKPLLRVLWAGQPETECCIASLMFFLELLKKSDLNVELYLRSHPEDKGASTGAYECLTHFGVPMLDANGLSLDESFFASFHLVVTQFSSVAIEGGFYKVPTLNILQKEVGRQLLFERTGSVVLALEECDASFILNDDLDLPILISALTSDEERLKKLKNFDQFYHVNTLQMPLLISAIEGIL